MSRSFFVLMYFFMIYLLRKPERLRLISEYANKNKYLSTNIFYFRRLWTTLLTLYRLITISLYTLQTTRPQVIPAICG